MKLLEHYNCTFAIQSRSHIKDQVSRSTSCVKRAAKQFLPVTLCFALLLPHSDLSIMPAHQTDILRTEDFLEARAAQPFPSELRAETRHVFRLQRESDRPALDLRVRSVEQGSATYFRLRNGAVSAQVLSHVPDGQFRGFVQLEVEWGENLDSITHF
jgi:hypothetical protein